MIVPGVLSPRNAIQRVQELNEGSLPLPAPQPTGPPLHPAFLNFLGIFTELSKTEIEKVSAKKRLQAFYKTSKRQKRRMNLSKGELCGPIPLIHHTEAKIE